MRVKFIESDGSHSEISLVRYPRKFLSFDRYKCLARWRKIHIIVIPASVSDISKYFMETAWKRE